MAAFKDLVPPFKSALFRRWGLWVGWGLFGMGILGCRSVGKEAVNHERPHGDPDTQKTNTATERGQ